MPGDPDRKISNTRHLKAYVFRVKTEEYSVDTFQSWRKNLTNDQKKPRKNVILISRPLHQWTRYQTLDIHYHEIMHLLLRMLHTLIFFHLEFWNNNKPQWIKTSIIGNPTLCILYWSIVRFIIKHVVTVAATNQHISMPVWQFSTGFAVLRCSRQSLKFKKIECLL